jgi:hypothetical protein
MTTIFTISLYNGEPTSNRFLGVISDGIIFVQIR